MERERQFGRGRGAAVVPRSVRCTVYMCPRVTDCNTQREEYRIPINGRRGCGEGLEPAEPPAIQRIPYIRSVPSASAPAQRTATHAGAVASHGEKQTLFQLEYRIRSSQDGGGGGQRPRMHTHTHARNELSNLPGRSYMPRVRPWVSGFAWPVQKRTLCRMAYTSDGLCIWLVRRVGVSVSGPTITDDPNTTYFESLRFEMLTVTLPQSVATKSSFHLKYVHLPYTVQLWCRRLRPLEASSRGTCSRPCC